MLLVSPSLRGVSSILIGVVCGFRPSAVFFFQGCPSWIGLFRGTKGETTILGSSKIRQSHMAASHFWWTYFRWMFSAKPKGNRPFLGSPISRQRKPGTAAAIGDRFGRLLLFVWESNHWAVVPKTRWVGGCLVSL